MLPTMRRWASVHADGKVKTAGKVLTLEHFLQRQRVVSLWRDCVRAINRIPPSATKHEMRHFARHEFERFRHVDDLQHIRYLLSAGKTQLDSMSRYVQQIHARPSSA